MATYRLEAKVIGRSKGRSATASAAYRAAAKLEDERTGVMFDYTRKRGVLHSEIIAPAGTPEWMRDRAQLWNAVEKVERRKDAQLARDLVLSLPHELTHEQRRELVREFVTAEFVGQGMIADIAIHAPDRRSDDRNHHAHVMLTMRELTSEGFGMKARAWNQTELLEQWRADWAQAVNTHLERAGHTARVDHRSNAAQGLDREPEPKQGPVATEMEREGRSSYAGDDRRAVQERNERRARLADELAIITAEIIDLETERAKRQPEGRDEKEVEPPPVDEITDAEARYKKSLGQHYNSANPYASLALAAQAEYDAFASNRRNLDEQIAQAKDPTERRALELRKEIEAADYMAITNRRIAGQSQFITGRNDSAEAVRANAQAVDYETRGKELRRQLHELKDDQKKRDKLMNTPTKDLTPEEQREQRREILRQATERRGQKEPLIRPPDIDRER